MRGLYKLHRAPPSTNMDFFFKTQLPSIQTVFGDVFVISLITAPLPFRMNCGTYSFQESSIA